jgi:hypothetical protein
MLGILMLVAVGCGGTDTGNPFSLELSWDAHSSNPNAVDVGPSALRIAVDQAWIATGTVGFATADNCDELATATIDPLGPSDHAATGAVLQRTEVREGDYCRLVLPLLATETLPANAPTELQGMSVLLLGTTADGTAFRVATDFIGDIDLAAVGNSFALDSQTPNTFIGFDVAKWLGNVDFSTAQLDGNGVIVIDPANNPTHYAAFVADLAAGIELYIDLDADGVADPEDVLIGIGETN